MGFLSTEKGRLHPRPPNNLAVMFIAIRRYPARAAGKREEYDSWRKSLLAGATPDCVRTGAGE
jgi:hypothetical protein